MVWMCVSTTTALWGLSSLLVEFRVTSAHRWASLLISQVRKLPKNLLLNFNYCNITVLNEITVTINRADPLIEWVQMDNSLLSACILEYVIADQTSQTLALTVNSTTRSLTAQQLNAAGFPYCTTIHPTVTPITPMGPLVTVEGSGNLVIKDPSKSTLSLICNFHYLFCYL